MIQRRTKSIQERSFSISKTTQQPPTFPFRGEKALSILCSSIKTENCQFLFLLTFCIVYVTIELPSLRFLFGNCEFMVHCRGFIGHYRKKRVSHPPDGSPRARGGGGDISTTILEWENILENCFSQVFPIPLGCFCAFDMTNK
jgi:hypothetical protein